MLMNKILWNLKHLLGIPMLEEVNELLQSLQTWEEWNDIWSYS